MLCAGVTVARAVGLRVGILVLHLWGSTLPCSHVLSSALSQTRGCPNTTVLFQIHVTWLMLCAGAGVSFVVLRLLYSVRLLLLVLD